VCVCFFDPGGQSRAAIKMSLKTSYTLLAPFYDLVAGPAFARARRTSLARLPRAGCHDIFLNGVGTGLDLRYLSAHHRYTALDLTRAMLARAVRHAGGLDIRWIQGDSQALPFKSACFDYAVLHLILAVVQDSVSALKETARVLKPGGIILILDKFLSVDAHAPLRRLVSPLVAYIATRTDVVFERVLQEVPGLTVESDEPALAGGWFRRIRLKKVDGDETASPG
jgi:phosphatidylethanolamine/phosphatidyl-N-methylethanolamine N-methyltransferase